MPELNYSDAFVKDLFDRMGPTYDLVNRISSLGFCEIWRIQCIRLAEIPQGAKVCDMMAGAGECWPYILRHTPSLVSIDFSRVMTEQQRIRNAKLKGIVDVRQETALQCSLESASMDRVICAFGLKTLDAEATRQYAQEIWRILKPGGRFCLIEISTADDWFLAPVFHSYINAIIPIVGKLLLGDIECYRMLGKYTRGFGSCENVAPIFKTCGFHISTHRHFYGCATSIVGIKPAA